MTSVKSMHYIGLEFIKPIWEPKENAAAAWLVVFNHAISFITVKTHVGSARDTELYRKVLQFSLKSLICNTVAFLRRFIHRGGFSCQIPKSIVGRWPWLSLAACRLWHLKAVSRLMSPHENLMKKVFPKRCRLREQRKTLISHITAGKGKLKGAHEPHWHSEWAGFVLQINTSLTLAAWQTFCIWRSHGVYGIFHSAPSQRSSLATSQKYSLFRAASFRQSRSRLWFSLFC